MYNEVRNNMDLVTSEPILPPKISLFKIKLATSVQKHCTLFPNNLQSQRIIHFKKIRQTELLTIFMYLRHPINDQNKMVPQNSKQCFFIIH